MLPFLQIIIIYHHLWGKGLMNPIHKSLTISSLAHSIFLSWLSVPLVGTQ
jgi:hypothetical protein